MGYLFLYVSTLVTFDSNYWGVIFVSSNEHDDLILNYAFLLIFLLFLLLQSVRKISEQSNLFQMYFRMAVWLQMKACMAGHEVSWYGHILVAAQVLYDKIRNRNISPTYIIFNTTDV